MNSVRLTRVLVVLIAIWFLAIYLPHVGGGFLKDDFVWLAQSRVATFGDAAALLGKNTGFYRPVVAATFAAEYALFGLQPLAYGLTNLLFVVLSAISIARLARVLGLAMPAAVMAAGIWALNPHGINMSLLWISGRTSLLLVLFATMAATAFVRGRTWHAAGWALLAMLSKEEATLLPVVFFLWSCVGLGTLATATTATADAGRTSPSFRARIVVALKAAAPALVALLAYVLLRSRSGAFGPASAPPYYAFLTDWRQIGINALEYLDRGATFAIVIVLLAWAIARRRPLLGRDGWRVVTLGVIWFAAGYAITVLLPIRSSLYACFPSVGASLIAAACIWALARDASSTSIRRFIAGVTLLAVVSVPFYWSRNSRWTLAAVVSTNVLAQLSEIVSTQPAGGTIVLHDRTDSRDESLAAAFGTLLPEAVKLTTSRPDVRVWLNPPPASPSNPDPQVPGTLVSEFDLRGNVLVARDLAKR